MPSMGDFTTSPFGMNLLSKFPRDVFPLDLWLAFLFCSGYEYPNITCIYSLNGHARHYPILGPLIDKGNGRAKEHLTEAGHPFRENSPRFTVARILYAIVLDLKFEVTAPGVHILKDEVLKFAFNLNHSPPVFLSMSNGGIFHHTYEGISNGLIILRKTHD